MILNCKLCGEEFNFKNINNNGLNMDGNKIKYVCRECGEKLEKELQERYFIEEYKEEVMKLWKNI